MAGPWEAFQAPQTKNAPPAYPYEGPTAAATLTGKTVANQKDIATLPYDIRKSKADAETAETNLRNLRGIPPGDVSKTGEEYLSSLPAGVQDLTREMLAGKYKGAITNSRNPAVMQAALAAAHATHGNFDAAKYDERQKLITSMVDPNSQLGALNTALAHAGHFYDQMGDVAGSAPFGHTPLSTGVNAVENWWNNASPAVKSYEGTLSKYGPEQAKAYGVGTGGERTGLENQYDINLPLDSKRALLKNDVQLYAGKIGSMAHGYDMLGGNSPLDYLSPDAKAALQKIDPDTYQKIFGTPVNANAFPGAAPAVGGSPPSGGNPPQAPDYSTMVPNGGGLGGGSAPSGSSTTNVYDPQTSALVNGYLKKGLSYHDAVAQLAKDAPGANLAGLTSPSQWNAALAWRQAHPNANTNQVPATKSVPLSMGDQILNNVAQNPAGAFAGHYYNALSADLPELAAGQDRSAFFNGVSGAQNPWSSRIGDIAGTIGGMSLAGKGVGLASDALESRFPNYAKLIAGSAPRQALTGDTIYSGVSGAAQNPNHPVLGASLGMLAAAGGNVAGRYIGGPLVSAIADTRPGQAVVNGVRSLGQLAGKTPTPFVPPPPPAISLTGATQKALPDITDKLTQAQNAGLPYMLADADPRLAKLLGSATRFSPDVYDQASGILGPRQLGQGERAISQINTNLAPVGDIDAIKGAQIQAAQAAAKPLYDQTYSLPGRTNDQLNALLSTPAGKQAMIRARTIAANEQRDPNALGIDLNAQGEPVLTSLPSPQTIDYVKRGLDDILEQYRNPVTGQMNLDEAGRATLGVKNGILQQADLLWPDYGQARAAYAADASKATDAQRGFDSASKGVTPDTVSSVVSGLPESNLPFFQQGYASNMGNAINNQRFSGNPYDLVNGSLGQKAKLATIFPQGADAFNTAQGLEGDMSRTNQIVLGNSTTQNKAMDDKLFTLGDGVDAGMDMGNVALAGGNPLLALGSLALRKGIDNARYGMSRAKADTIAPFLMNPDPSLNLANLNLWAQQNAARKAYLDTIGAGAGQIGAGLAGAPAIYGFSQN